MYKSVLNLFDTQVAIKLIKDNFENKLAKKLNLTRVSAPLFVMKSSGLNDYLNGFPSKSYESFNEVMEILMDRPLRIYQKSAVEQFLENGYLDKDKLKLFRATCVSDNKPYGRSRVFHTPYTMRSRVSTSRYSIAGYPSLYLGTCLDLCCEEIHVNPQYDFVLASAFKLERVLRYCNTNIRVIELGVKPQDFHEQINERSERRIDSNLLKNNKTRSAYLLAIAELPITVRNPKCFSYCFNAVLYSKDKKERI